MLGVMIGDIIGSVYETFPVKHKQFNVLTDGSGFTDDTVLTAAIMEWILDGSDLVDLFHRGFHTYPGAGWGRTFAKWAKIRDRDPYNSFGNGSAMRVMPVGWAYQTIGEVERVAKQSSAVTHDHPEGIAAAVAIAGCVFLARNGASKEEIKAYASKAGNYKLDFSLAEIRDSYQFQVYAIYSVPQAIVAFLEGDSYIDSIRNAVSLGGDADTQAAIAGGIAEAFYGKVDQDLASQILQRLDRPLYEIARRFYAKHCPHMWVDII